MDLSPTESPPGSRIRVPPHQAVFTQPTINLNIESAAPSLIASKLVLEIRRQFSGPKHQLMGYSYQERAPRHHLSRGVRGGPGDPRGG